MCIPSDFSYASFDLSAALPSATPRPAASSSYRPHQNHSEPHISRRTRWDWRSSWTRSRRLVEVPPWVDFRALCYARLACRQCAKRGAAAVSESGNVSDDFSRASDGRWVKFKSITANWRGFASCYQLPRKRSASSRSGIAPSLITRQ
jgi:hypothetical protein